MLSQFNEKEPIGVCDMLIGSSAKSTTKKYYHWTNIAIDYNGKYCLSNNVDI